MMVENLYQSSLAKEIVQVVIVLVVEGHRIIKKNFDTDLWLDGKQLPLNHMMQETIGNIMEGFSKTLKGAGESSDKIEVKIKRLHQKVDVDAHTYPQIG